MKTQLQQMSQQVPDTASDSTTLLSPVTLAVSNLQQSADFYSHLVGFAELHRTSHHAVLGISGQPLLNLQQAATKPPGHRTTGLYHVAILLPSRPALAQKLNHLTSAGVRIAGAADHGVSEALYLADPEGNGIEIYADRPRDHWPMNRGQLEMGTQRLDMSGLLAEAPTRAGSPALSTHTRIGHLHLRVADLSAAEDFYRNVLKMDLMQRFGQSASFLSYGGYHHHIGLNTWESLGAPPYPAGAPGLVEFHLRPPTQAIYHSIKTAANAAQMDNELRLRDPSGNCVVVTAPRPIEVPAPQSDS